MLYHCPNPLETLRCLREITGEFLILATASTPEVPGLKQACVFYPGLDSHPQAELVRRQQSAGGAVVSFEVADRDAAWRVIDGCRMISITANLGDTRSTITHPATTTHGRVAPEVRAAAGIGEGLLRVAIGLENVDDLVADLSTGLQ